MPLLSDHLTAGYATGCLKVRWTETGTSTLNRFVGCRWRITNNALKEGLLEKRKRVLDQPDGCYSFGPRCAVASWSTQSSSS